MAPTPLPSWRDTAAGDLHAALDLLPGGIGLFDAAWLLTYGNASFGKLRSLPPKLCKPGTPLVDIISHIAARGDYGQGSLEVLVSERLAEATSGKPWEAEQDIPGGRRLQISHTPTPDGGVMITYADVTEARITERKLRDSEQRYATAMQAINEAVYEWNVDTGEMYYSPRLHDTLGLTPDELRTREDWLNRVHPEDLPGYRAATVAHLKGQTERLEVEYRYWHSDGSWHWARQHGVASRRSDGRAFLMAGSTGDISAERKLAEELDRARGQLHDALETIGEGFALFDAGDRIVMCNSRYRSLFLQVGDQVVPGNSFENFMRAAIHAGLFPAAGNDPQAFLATVQARRKAPSGPREQYLRSGIWLQISDYKMTDGSHVGVYTDITEQKLRQQEVARAKAEAEETLEKLKAAQQQLITQGKMASLGQLTAGIAHEIKNPLNFVTNFASVSRELLDELQQTIAPLQTKIGGEEIDGLIADLSNNLVKISEHSARADRIVRNMLRHSRTGEVQRGVIAINQVVEESLNLAYHSARVEIADLEIRIDRQFDSAAGDMECFPQELSRALLNIIANGIYAAHKHRQQNGGAALVVSTAAGPASVVVRIRDNGQGIAAELRERLFTPFFTTKPPGEGTGLGLSLAYDIIVKQHGGQITCDSVPDSFAEFVVTVPRTAPAA